MSNTTDREKALAWWNRLPLSARHDIAILCTGHTAVTDNIVYQIWEALKKATIK